MPDDHDPGPVPPPTPADIARDAAYKRLADRLAVAWRNVPPDVRLIGYDRINRGEHPAGMVSHVQGDVAVYSWAGFVVLTLPVAEVPRTDA